MFEIFPKEKNGIFCNVRIIILSIYPKADRLKGIIASHLKRYAGVTPDSGELFPRELVPLL